jgi:glucuronokinase
MLRATGRAFARAALAGNPSDGFGGATLAVPIRELAAEVELVAEPGAERPASVDPEARRLVEAARRRLSRELDLPPVAIGCVATTIPREVGLGGSSAIVTAALRAFLAHAGASLAPLDLARVALEAETHELGIAAGPQDRIVQAFETLVAMDFAGAEPRCQPLDPALLPPLFLAWRTDSAAHSGAVHGDLRARWEAAHPGTRACMERLAGHARDAHAALLDGNHGAFAAALDASFDVRRELIEDLDPRHVRMIEVARAAGASANYAGSGGAIVGTAADLDDVRAALEREACAVLLPGYPRADGLRR